MAIEAIHFELATVLILFPIVAFFVFLLHQYYAGKKNTLIKRLTFLLALIWLESASQLFTEFWTVYEVFGFSIPPIHMILEVGVAGYLSATLWHLWWHDKDIDLT